jgi:predicted transcriptional regulator
MTEKAPARNWKVSDMPVPVQRIIKVAGDTEIHGAAKSLFTHMALKADDSYEISLSMNELADAIGVGVATIARSITALERAGYIQRLPRAYATERTTINIAPPLKTSA